jgi:hypothetical protein
MKTTDLYPYTPNTVVILITALLYLCEELPT